jgi:putative nucleotidyltransferase with HDIG domain
MSAAAEFLNALGHALATMTLYQESHPARERAIDVAYVALEDLQAETPKARFTFLGEEIVLGTQRLRELRSWEWGARLAEAGVQRLEFAEQVQRDDFEAFLDEVLARMSLSAAQTAAARPMRETRIKYGAVGLRGEERTDGPLPTATLTYSLGPEVDTIRWMHEQVQGERPVPLAMHGDRQILLPLLRLRSFDEYTTTHSMNVSVLAMALAEYLRLGPAEVRALGVAGLLHDIGKVRIPREVLTKPGKLTPEEWAMVARHPVDGARIIVEGREQSELAAVVAYEHHVMLDGGGYPTFRFPRECHFASKLVHVCDVYDALRTDRPYRDAWASDKVLEYIDERASKEFDPELAAAFTAMMRRWETRVATLQSEDEPVRAPETPPTPADERGEVTAPGREPGAPQA